MLHEILTREHAPLAQLDRASDYESEGQPFKSARARFGKPRNFSELWGFCACGSRHVGEFDSHFDSHPVLIHSPRVLSDAFTGVSWEFTGQSREPRRRVVLSPFPREDR
jgi:hypothetical protein